MLPFPIMGLESETAMSTWAAEQCRSGSGAGTFCPSLLVTPATTYEEIVDGVQRFGFVNLKPYHCYSIGENRVPSTGESSDNTACADTALPPPPPLPTKTNPITTLKRYACLDCLYVPSDAEIEDFLTEDHCRAAHDLNLGITLHMVKPRALAEESNQKTIRKYCEAYPNMKMILAHCARGFNMYHTIEAIDTLAGLDNVYFDTGAICEAGAIHACIKAFGSKRVMYGSDWPVSEVRGSCVSVGDQFQWIYPNTAELNPSGADPLNETESAVALIGL